MTTSYSPAVQVLKGQPDADELAALVASLLTATPSVAPDAPRECPAPSRVSGWNDPVRSARGGARVPRSWYWSSRY